MKKTRSNPDFTRSLSARWRPGTGTLAAAAFLLLAASLHAVPIRVSQMVGFADGILGSVGGSEGWKGSSGLFTVTNGTGSLDGTPLGLYPSAGDHVRIAATSSPNSPNTYNEFAAANQFPQSMPINLYYSFLYRFTTATNLSTTTSNKIAQVNRQNSGSASHFEVHALADGNGKIRIGVAKTNGVPEYSPNTVNVGETFFVVVRQQIIAGGTATLGNDIIDLWVNPPAASFGVDEWSVPSPDASATVGGGKTPAPPGPDDCIFTRAGTAPSLTSCVSPPTPGRTSPHRLRSVFPPVLILRRKTPPSARAFPPRFPYRPAPPHPSINGRSAPMAG